MPSHFMIGVGIAMADPGLLMSQRRREDFALFEVDVNGVRPSEPVVNQVPDFDRSLCRIGRNAVRIHRETLAAVGFDRPRFGVRTVGMAKGERTLACRCQFRDCSR